MPFQNRDGGDQGRYANGGASSVLAAEQLASVGNTATVSPPVAPDVSKAVDLLHQAFGAANGSGNASRHVPDNTWEQIASLLQQYVVKNQSMHAQL
jgi:hypothetical protein